MRHWGCSAVSVETVGFVETESAWIRPAILCFCPFYGSLQTLQTQKSKNHDGEELWRIGTWPLYQFIKLCRFWSWFLCMPSSKQKAGNPQPLQPLICNEAIRLPRSAPPSRRPLQGIYPAIHSATFLFAGFLPNHSHFILTDFDVIDIGEAGF